MDPSEKYAFVARQTGEWTPIQINLAMLGSAPIFSEATDITTLDSTTPTSTIQFLNFVPLF